MTDSLEVLPFDQFNQELVNNVHPPDWVNPEPDGRYNLVAIGAGTAGLVTALGAAGLGAKVAMIERHLMGGDCLNFGCVPSKGLIRAGRAAASVRCASDFGIGASNEAVDFAAVMERMRKLRAQISHNDSAERCRRDGVDMFIGEATFEDSNTIRVGDKRLKFKNAVICTGARAKAPAIPGLEEAGYLTNETVFSLAELPKRMAVIGAGPIGSELAQAFARFGCQVTVLEMQSHILAREDADACEVVQESMVRDGIDLRFQATVAKITSGDDGKCVHFEQNGKEQSVTTDEILVAIGRAPNIDGLNLDRVGVETNQFGVVVDDFLRTTNPKIYAAGDICSRFKFTHAADYQARIVIRNTLFWFLPKARASRLVIPWCTYTDPELAHVGLTEATAAKAGIAVQTLTQPLADVDRAILDGEDEGFVRVHLKEGTDKIVGATIVASHAGDMISEICLAMTNNLGIKSIGGTIHPYPTQADAIRKLGDAFNRTRMSPKVRRLFERVFSFGR
ncbi:MAG: mercuric reductase [Planctomycetaceae bacterium]|nr:mercuric reductase [Planctomycetaceae bacterium]